MSRFLRTFILFFLLQFGFIVSAQPIVKQKSEMLKVELQKKLNDTVRVLKLQELSLYYVLKPDELKADMDSSFTCARQAELLSNKINFEKGKWMSLILYSQIYREGGDPKKGRIELDKVFKIAAKKNVSWLKGEAYQELTNYYGVNDGGIYTRIILLEKSLAAFRKGGSKKQIADVLVFYGSQLNFVGRYKLAILQLLEAKSIYEAIGYTDLQNLYSQMFRTYTKMSLYKEAAEYGHLSLKLSEQNKDPFYLMDDNNYLGLTYYRMENYALALKYHQKAFDYSTKVFSEFMPLNIANWILRDLLKLGRKKEAKHFLDTVIKTQKIKDAKDLILYKMSYLLMYDEFGWYKSGDKLCNNLIDLQEKNKGILFTGFNYEINSSVSNHLFKIKKYGLALKYLDKNNKTAISIKDINMIINGHLMAFKIDSASGNYLSAISNFKKYQKIKDSLFNDVKSYQISNLEIQYQTENKDQNIQLLTKESALQKAKIKSDKVAKVIAALVLFLVLIITGLIFRGYQNKKQSNRELEESKNNIEKKNKILQNVVQEKEWLLKEIHHRVKNNLQVVMSLLNTQSSYLKDESAVMAIKDSQNRINSMSLIHQRLYQSEGLSCIKMPEYIKELVSHLKDSYQMNYKFIIAIEDIEMHVSQAIPIGLILNEAITNAIKYAFPNGENGTISITLKHFEDDYFLLEIADNGIGIDGEIDISKYNSLGMKLMEGLSHDLNGKLNVINNNGLKIAITFVYDYAFNFK